MIRIQAAHNSGGIAITIDGQLTGEYIAEVEDSIRTSIEQYKDVRRSRYRNQAAPDLFSGTIEEQGSHRCQTRFAC